MQSCSQSGRGVLAWLVATPLLLLAMCLFAEPAAASADVVDRVAIEISELGYHAEGDLVTGAIACTDNLFDGAPQMVAGRGTVAGAGGDVGVVVDIRRLLGPLMVGSLRLSDPAAGISVTAWAAVPPRRTGERTVAVRARGLATVGARRVLVTVKLSVEDRQLDPGDHAVHITHNGLARLAIAHVPPGVSGPVPTLVALPGLIETHWMFELFGKVAAHADAHGYIVVFAAHHGLQWVLPGWPGADAVDDPGFLRRLLDVLEGRFGSDPSRLYATGMSNGGFLTHQLACAMNDRFAAFAPVSGTMIGAEDCAPGRSIPVVMLHGTGDWVVPYWQAPLFFGGRSAPASAQFWAENNGCDPTPVDTPLADIDPGDRTRVVRHDWTGCPDDAPVVLYEIQNGGHLWPGGIPFLPPPILGEQTYDITANDVVWDFVSRFRL